LLTLSLRGSAARLDVFLPNQTGTDKRPGEYFRRTPGIIPLKLDKRFDETFASRVKARRTPAGEKPDNYRDRRDQNDRPGYHKSCSHSPPRVFVTIPVPQFRSRSGFGAPESCGVQKRCASQNYRQELWLFPAYGRIANGKGFETDTQSESTAIGTSPQARRSTRTPGHKEKRGA